MKQTEIYARIVEERNRQDRLHPNWYGDQHGLVVLAEEFGEVAKALYELNNRPTMYMVASYEEYKAIEEGLENALEDEIIQCAAVCIRWLENR